MLNRAVSHKTLDNKRMAEAQQRQIKESKDAIDYCEMNARNLENIIDAKTELEKDKVSLQNFDRDFYNQLTERIA
jgi:hypothetical protein